MMNKSAIIMRSAHTKVYTIVGILDPDVAHYTDLWQFGEAHLRGETPDIKVVCQQREGNRWARLTVQFPNSFMRFDYDFFKSDSFDMAELLVSKTED